jgi:hypothetical protein
MLISEQINRRIVELGYEKWVRGMPEYVGEACLVYQVDQSGDGFRGLRARFSFEALRWLNNWFRWATAADSLDGWGIGAVEWNDGVYWSSAYARSKQHVIEMLDDAWYDAVEEGV